MRYIIRFNSLILCLYLLACQPTSSSADSESRNGTIDIMAPATTPIDWIDFYEDGKTMNDILTTTMANEKTPVLFFTAKWCKPCQEFKDGLQFEMVAAALKDATIISIDLDKDKEGYAKDYGARLIPTFIMVDKDGTPLNTISGAAWAYATPDHIAPAMTSFLKG